MTRFSVAEEVEGCWKEVLVEDKTCTTAELAASRIDFAAWLASLPARDRRAAKLLAAGERTLDIAGRLGICPARVSQLRRELKASWEQFHEPRDDEPKAAALAA